VSLHSFKAHCADSRSSIDFTFAHGAQSKNCDLKLLISDTGGVFVRVRFDMIDKSWRECPPAWREAVCSAGPGERGRQLISTLAPAASAAAAAAAGS